MGTAPSKNEISILSYTFFGFLHFQNVHLASLRPAKVLVHVHNIVSVVLVQSGLVLNGEGVVADSETVHPAEVQLPVVATHLRPIGRVNQTLASVKIDHSILGNDGEVRIV